MPYPDWVLKYKTKGTYINKVKDTYYLYRGHSKRVKGTNKIKRICDEYLGKITEIDGFVPAKHKVIVPIVYNYGIPYGIYLLTKTVTNTSRNLRKYSLLIKSLGVINYLYKTINKDLFDTSVFSILFPISYDDINDTILAEVDRCSKKIHNYFSSFQKDDYQLLLLNLSLITLVKIKNNYTIINNSFNNELLYKYKLEGLLIWPK